MSFSQSLVPSKLTLIFGQYLVAHLIYWFYQALVTVIRGLLLEWQLSTFPDDISYPANFSLEFRTLAFLLSAAEGILLWRAVPSIKGGLLHSFALSCTFG